MESSDRTPDTSAHDAALPDSPGSAPEASPAPEHRTEQPAEARAAGAAPSSSEHTDADATPTNDGAPTGPAAATGGAPAGVAFPRQPYSFVRRGDRLSPKRQKAWDEHADEWVLDIPRVMTDTSVDPSYRLDHAAVFGRTAPLVVEIGSGLGEAIVAHAAGYEGLIDITPANAAAESIGGLDPRLPTESAVLGAALAAVAPSRGPRGRRRAWGRTGWRSWG